MGFWIEFAISEALNIVSAFIAATPALTPQQKTDAEAFITSGQKLLSDFVGT